MTDQKLSFGQKYPIHIGSSLAEKEHDDCIDRYVTAQYVFRPSSIDANKLGSISVGQTGETVMKFAAVPKPNESKTDATTEQKENTPVEDYVCLKGSLTNPVHEYLLVFEPPSFDDNEHSVAVNDRPGNPVFTLQNVSTSYMALKHDRAEEQFQYSNSELSKNRYDKKGSFKNKAANVSKAKAAPKQKGKQNKKCKDSVATATTGNVADGGSTSRTCTTSISCVASEITDNLISSSPNDPAAVTQTKPPNKAPRIE